MPCEVVPASIWSYWSREVRHAGAALPDFGVKWRVSDAPLQDCLSCIFRNVWGWSSCCV